MATPLLVGPEQKEALYDLRIKAAKKPVDMQLLMEDFKDPAKRAVHQAQMTEQSIVIPFAFFVTFSLETGHPGGVARHMSMSSFKPNRLPTPEAVWMIAYELGFTGTLEACDGVWIEDLSDGGKAINVLQLLP
jgi:hypothetical protein